MSTGTSPSSGQQHIVIDGISYIPSSVLLTGIPKLSIKDNRAFAVMDSMGQMPRVHSPASELGFFFNDTRYLGIWEMSINGETPVALTSDLHHNGNAIVVSMSNRDLPRLDGGRIPRDTLLVRRILGILDDQVFEALEIKNFGTEPCLLQVEMWSGGRFDDVFEVRGFVRKARGRMLPAEEVREAGSLTTIHQYEGLDQIIRRTHIRRYFEVEKLRASPGLAGYFSRITVPAKETVSLRTLVGFDRPPDDRLLGEPPFNEAFPSITTPRMMQVLSSRRDKAPPVKLTFECDNAIVTRALTSALTDVYMLLTREGELVYPYAGIPWFSAPFGRDGIIAAYQMLPWQPWIAKGVLNYVFQTLGKEFDAFTDEEPGKVFHEMRRGEMSKMREVPFIPYYGSVDSTPLAIILLQEYIRWTRDLSSLKEWWPAVIRALEWIDKWGDPDRKGFLEYSRRSSTGLVNQGWKDSNDSVMHADGELAMPPIRLCEVQGYAFRARLAVAELAHLMDDPLLASRTRSEALRLRSLFSEHFWDGDRQIVALALDADGNPCAVRSSNMGHCLWTEILSSQQAAEVSRHLFSDAMFSGYGIRTLADTEVAYNPMSYHNGSVWPHDNSIIMEGLRKYGLTRELEILSTAMMDVIEASDDFRLPELFCGFRRRGNAPPVPYQVACKPQAWAAGSLFLMMKSMLGLAADACLPASPTARKEDSDYLVFHSPVLSPKISRLEIRGLEGRDWELDLGFRRTQTGVLVEVLKKSGKVRVLTVR